MLFAIDRAGLVGEDGPTHHGAFDLSYLRCIPNLVIMTPSDENECRQMLHTGYVHPGPAAVRYPRGSGPGAELHSELTPLPIGKGVIRRQRQAADGGSALLAFGAPLSVALQAAQQRDVTVADMRFVKTLDEELVVRLAQQHEQLITLEENATAGGAGSAVLECLARNGIHIPVVTLGIPDRYIDHASVSQQHEEIGLTLEHVLQTIDRKGDNGH